MGRFTEEGKKFDIFKQEPQGGTRSRIKLLCGMRIVLPFGKELENKLEIIAYFVKTKGQIYEIVKYDDDFLCYEYDIDEIIIPENMIGIGNCDVVVEDLDAMFGDWENYCKKLKPITEENIDKLLEEYPELNEGISESVDLIMEMYWFRRGSFSHLMQDIQNEYNSLAGKANKKFRNALKNKIDGALYAYNLEKTAVRPIVKRGEIWKASIPVGVGSVSNGYRYVVIISRELHANNSRTVNVVNITSAIDHRTGNRKQIKNEWQLEMTSADFEDGALRDDSYVNIADLFTVDKLQLETRIGKVKDEFLKKIVGRVAEQISVFDEPIEIDINEFFK